MKTASHRTNADNKLSKLYAYYHCGAKKSTTATKEVTTTEKLYDMAPTSPHKFPPIFIPLSGDHEHVHF